MKSLHLIKTLHFSAGALSGGFLWFVAGCAGPISNPDKPDTTGSVSEPAVASSGSSLSKSDHSTTVTVSVPERVSLNTGAPNEQFIRDAWDAFKSGRYEEAIRSADKCVMMFSGDAERIERNLADSGESVPIGAVSSEQKERIFRNGPLNDVATGLHIMGVSYESLGKKKEAAVQYAKVEKLPHARTWDTQGWFWSPADHAKERLDKYGFRQFLK